MKRTFKGKVVSDRMEKSVVVAVTKKKTHPIYRKKYIQTKKFMAENEIGAAKNDFVIIEETSPLSKSKKWKAIKVIAEKEVGK